jgi:hypothetical protein
VERRPPCLRVSSLFAARRRTPTATTNHGHGPGSTHHTQCRRLPTTVAATTSAPPHAGRRHHRRHALAAGENRTGPSRRCLQLQPPRPTKPRLHCAAPRSSRGAAGSGDGSRCRRRGCPRRRAVLGGPGGRGHLEPPGRKRGTTPPPSPRAARTSGGHLRRRRGAMVAATTRFFASRYNKVILEMDSLPLLHMLPGPAE